MALQDTAHLAYQVSIALQSCRIPILTCEKAVVMLFSSRLFTNPSLPSVCSLSLQATLIFPQHPTRGSRYHSYTSQSPGLVRRGITPHRHSINPAGAIRSANKTSIPTQMINYLAGIGEFAIKCGGPPIVTRVPKQTKCGTITRRRASGSSTKLHSAGKLLLKTTRRFCPP